MNKTICQNCNKLVPVSTEYCILCGELHSASTIDKYCEKGVMITALFGQSSPGLGYRNTRLDRNFESNARLESVSYQAA